MAPAASIGHPFESLGEAGPGGWIPAVETEETSDAYMVRAELPGMKREDVNVELRGTCCASPLFGAMRQSLDHPRRWGRRDGITAPVGWRYAVTRWWRASCSARAALDTLDQLTARNITQANVPTTA